MFKLALLALMLVPATVNADTGVFDVMNDSITVFGFNVSSAANSGPRQMFTAELQGASTGFPLLMEGRKVLEIQNIDATSDMFCQIALSSTSAAGDLALTAPASLSTSTAHLIAPKGSWILGLPAREQGTGRVFIPWCMNNSGSGNIRGSATQGRTK